jgi:hypothetical protein
MAESFDDLSREMGKARAALRSFTLGQEGLTPKDGADAISLVSSLCERLQKQFGSGKHASEVAGTVVMARGQVLAAKARLTLLQKREAASAPRNGQKRGSRPSATRSALARPR